MKSMVKVIFIHFLVIFITFFTFLIAVGLLFQFPHRKAMCNFHKIEIGMTKSHVTQLLGLPKNGKPAEINIFVYDTYVIDGDDSSVSFDANDNVYSKSCSDRESCSTNQHICYFVR